MQQLLSQVNCGLKTRMEMIMWIGGEELVIFSQIKADDVKFRKFKQIKLKNKYPYKF
jgi:hypothetical protein